VVEVKNVTFSMREEVEKIMFLPSTTLHRFRASTTASVAASAEKAPAPLGVQQRGRVGVSDADDAAVDCSDTFRPRC
jgi:hypothetical protein